MKALIADLIVDIPEVGDLLYRCKDYLYEGKECADIIIRTDLFSPEEKPEINIKLYTYLKSGALYYRQLLKFGGMMLHASAVEIHGKVYLFSGNCGVGKSTHTRLWQTVYREEAHVINDDKPALRLIDGIWYAYGTPWCGKDAININAKAPVAGICFLKQSDKNFIRRLSPKAAIPKIFLQTTRRLQSKEELELMISHVDQLVRKIPIFEFENRPEPAAAYLSYETMRRAAEELGL